MPDQNRKNHGDKPARVRRGNDERNEPYPYGGERDGAGTSDPGASGEPTTDERVPHGGPPHGSSYGDRDPSARDANQHSDDRIREEAPDRLTDDQDVDASDITVQVPGVKSR